MYSIIRVSQNQRTILWKSFSLLLISVLISSLTWAHCQVPCGIFNDDARLDSINEHIRTIEKSMNKIEELGSSNLNQTIRWVETKEQHAQELHTILHDYFLAQRLKPLKPKASKKERAAYQEKLTVIHELTIAAMKSKQSTDQKWIQEMKKLSKTLHKVFHK